MVLVVLYALLGFFLAPQLLQKTLTETMKNEFNADFRVDRIEVNPFALSLRVNGLSLDNPDGEPTLRMQEFFANFQLSSIFRLALTFDEIRFTAAELFVARNQAGEMDFTYLTKSSTEERVTETSPAKDETALLPVLIYQFKIEEFIVHWVDQVPIEPVKTRIGPIAVDIEELNTLPNRTGHQSVEIKTQNLGNLSWSGDLQLNPLRSSAHASFEVAQFALVSAYIRHQTGIDIVDGSANMELDYKVEQAEDGRISASVENFNLALNDILLNSFADGTGFDFAGNNQQILALPKLAVAGGRLLWPEKTLSLETVSIDNAGIDTLRNENGVFNLEPRSLQTNEVASPTSQTATATATGGKTTPDGKSVEDQWQFSIGVLSVNQLKLNLIDQSVTPATQLGITEFNLQLSEVSNQAGARMPMTLSLQALSGGRISLEGGVNLLPQPAFDFDVSVDELLLAVLQPYVKQQVNLDLNSGAINLQGKIAGAARHGQVEARVDNFNLALSDLVIHNVADEPRKILEIPRLAVVDGQLLWPEKAVSLASVSIDNASIDALRDENGVVSYEPRTIKDKELDSSASQNTTATAEKTLDELNTSDKAGQDQWSVSIGAFSTNNLKLNLTDHGVTPAAQLGLSEFNLQLSELSNQPGARIPMTLDLKVLSGGRVSLEGGVTLLPQPAFDIDVAVDGLQLAVLQPYLKQQANLNLNSAAIYLQGKIAGSADEIFAYNGNFEIAELDIAESINNQRLASWKRFSADKIALSLAKRELDISQLRFDRLYGDILIDREGNLNVGQVAKKDPVAAQENANVATEAPAPQAAAAPATQAGDSEFKIQIGSILLSEAAADFADLSLPLPFAVKIDSLNGRITTISNQSTEPSEIDIEGKVDDYGFAHISGIVTPLNPRKNTNILLDFKNIDLPKFSPYTIPFAGRKIASGSLDLKLGYKLENSKLVGENSIILRDFELGEKVPHPKAMDVPLELAVALLKDASGKINIDLPVSGDVDDPEFSYGSFVRATLGDFLVKIVLSPFSLLGNLLGVEASELENINYLYGRSDLTPPELQRVGKLAEALALRPELQLIIKGVFAEKADSLALQSAKLNKTLERRITELADTSDPSIQYPAHRRSVLEQMTIEQLGQTAASARLSELEAKFTTSENIEGQTEPVTSFDSLAYTSALHQQLVELQTLDPNALKQLAEARANALQSALLSIDQSLQPRIQIAESITITAKKGEAIKMPVTLNTMAQ